MATNNAINANSVGLQRYDGAGTFDAVTTTQYGVQIGAASNGLSSQLLTDGQLIIGSTGVAPVASTLTAGTGIGIVNAAGSITISAAGGGLTWTVITGAAQALAVNNGYIANNAGTIVFTLPAIAPVGSVIAVTGINNNTGWQIAQNAGQTIYFGSANTTTGVGGSLTSTRIRDTVFLLCVVANNDWNVVDSVGNITIV